MASLRRHPRSPFWFACYTGVDGRRVQRSTGAADKNKALRIALEYEKAVADGRAGRFTENQARRVLADIFILSNKTALPSSTVADFMQSWLKRKELEAGEKTAIRYGVAVRQFLEHLGQRRNLEIAHLVRADVAGFRDALAQRASAGTANISIKILRAALSQARRDGLCEANAAEGVSLLKKREKSKRRGFTVEELKRVMAVADPEWRGMILTGFYTGLRLGDIAKLTWLNVDLQHENIRLETGKTARTMDIPIIEPLLKHLETIPAGDDPHQPLFPRAQESYEKSYFNGDLSRQFYRLLVSAQLAPPRKFKETGKGRQVRHQQNELSFHSLRHACTSELKNAGVSDAVAMDIIGHESAAMSAHYTHIGTEAKRSALAKLPDITA